MNTAASLKQNLYNNAEFDRLVETLRKAASAEVIAIATEFLGYAPRTRKAAVQKIVDRQMVAARTKARADRI